MSGGPVISFPHIGNYHIPVENLLRHVFPEHQVIPSPKTTKRTLELGSRHSPDFVCVPFKYNLGNFIEALEGGANVLFQAGGGCRYGYYAEIQEQILRDLGYDFTFIRIFGNFVNPLPFYESCRRIGARTGLAGFSYYMLLSANIARVMDELEAFIRENIGFEESPGEFERLHAALLSELSRVDSMHELKAVGDKYRELLSRVKINKPRGCLRVGIVGELYTLMEPFASFFIEKELAASGIEVKRFITMTFLLFQKPFMHKKVLSEAWPYLRYAIGADGTDSVGKGRMLARAGYDGLIHIKPFGCTPEVNAMPMLQNISKDYGIPVLYFSFDSQTSETGVKTRLEAFNDMLTMRKEKKGLA